MPRQRHDIRKRTGCTKCKEQHIRCSEELPRCRRCQRLNLECMRGLKLTFREDAIQRGISFGREGIWSKRPSTTVLNKAREVVFQGNSLAQYRNRWVFLNLCENDFQGPDDPPPTSHSPQQLHKEIDLSINLSIPDPILYHPLHSFSITESYLLDYFIRGISPGCSLSDLHNPYVSLVVPLCFVSVTLRHTLLAVAASRLCSPGNGKYMKQACHHKHIALTGLRHEISTGQYDDGTIASILMLCFHDISDGCSPSWMVHLRGGLQLVEGNVHRTSPELWKFFRMYFVAHDIMSRTTSESWSEDKTPELWTRNENLEEIDMLMGCSRGLMSLVNRISQHASTKDISETHEYDEITSEISTSLLSLKQKLPENSGNEKDLQRFAHIKHLAALLYMTERLGHSMRRGGEASLCLPILNNAVDNFHPVQSADWKNTLISSLIEHISTLPDRATLLWPLFVLGNAGLDNEDHRRFVLDRLVNIQKTQNLGSVRRTIDAVKYAFLTKDLLSPGERRWGHESYRDISLA